jgi:hypothetical protein
MRRSLAAGALVEDVEGPGAGSGKGGRGALGLLAGVRRLEKEEALLRTG